MIVPKRAFPDRNPERFHVGVEKNMLPEVLRIAESIVDQYDATEGVKPSILIVHSDNKFNKKHPVSISPKTHIYHDEMIVSDENTLVYSNKSSGEFDYDDYYDSVEDEADDSIAVLDLGCSFYYSGSYDRRVHITANNPKSAVQHFHRFVTHVAKRDKEAADAARVIYRNLLRKQRANTTCDCGCSSISFLDSFYRRAPGIFTMFQQERLTYPIAHSANILELAHEFFDIVITVMSHKELLLYSNTAQTYNLAPNNVFHITRNPDSIFYLMQKMRDSSLLPADFSHKPKNGSYFVRLTGDVRDVAQASKKGEASLSSAPLFLYEESKKNAKSSSITEFAQMLRTNVANAFIEISKGNSLPALFEVESPPSWRSPVRQNRKGHTIAGVAGSSFLLAFLTLLGAGEPVLDALNWSGIVSTISIPGSFFFGWRTEVESHVIVEATVNNRKAVEGGKAVDNRGPEYEVLGVNEKLDREERLLDLIEALESSNTPQIEKEIILDEISYLDDSQKYYDLYAEHLSPVEGELPVTYGNQVMKTYQQVKTPALDESIIIQRAEKLQERWITYELDPILLLEYPLMSDATCPETAAFIHSYEVMSFSIAAYNNNASTSLTELENKVEAAEKAFIVAESNAKKVRKSYLTAEQRKNLATARQLALLALDEEASPNERISAWKKANDYLEGIIVLPDTPVRGLLAAR